MICPLKSQAYDPHEQMYPDVDCDEEKCAWWDEKHGQCCIKTLSKLKVSGGVNTHSY